MRPPAARQAGVAGVREGVAVEDGEGLGGSVAVVGGVEVRVGIGGLVGVCAGTSRVGEAVAASIAPPDAVRDGLQPLAKNNRPAISSQQHKARGGCRVKNPDCKFPLE